jgi:hypothetical protein
MTNQRSYIEITDPVELQNILDDFGPLRPTLAVWGDEHDPPFAIYAPELELDAWRDSDVRVHRGTEAVVEGQK